MDFQKIAQQIVLANYHRGGIKLLRLFSLDPSFQNQLKSEVLDIIQSTKGSRDTDPGHVSNWNGPYGDVRQFSLLNKTGNTSDTNSDHSLDTLEKRFHYADKYPVLANLIMLFPDSVNFRIRILGPGSYLAPHEEHIIHKDKNKNFLRLRLHLPIQTNLSAQTTLDGSVYHLQERYIYLYNNGTIHSAQNNGNEERVHLVWDVFYTSRVHDLIFNQDINLIPGVHRLNNEEKIEPVIKKEKIREYIPSGPAVKWYQKLHLKKLNISQSTFSRLYNYFDYYIPRKIDLR